MGKGQACAHAVTKFPNCRRSQKYARISKGLDRPPKCGVIVSPGRAHSRPPHHRLPRLHPTRWKVPVIWGWKWRNQPCHKAGRRDGRVRASRPACPLLAFFVLFFFFSGDDFLSRRMGLPTMTAGGRMALWRIAGVRACVCVINLFILSHTDPTRPWRQLVSILPSPVSDR